MSVSIIIANDALVRIESRSFEGYAHVDTCNIDCATALNTALQDWDAASIISGGIEVDALFPEKEKNLVTYLGAVKSHTHPLENTTTLRINEQRRLSSFRRSINGHMTRG